MADGTGIRLVGAIIRHRPFLSSPSSMGTNMLPLVRSGWPCVRDLARWFFVVFSVSAVAASSPLLRGTIVLWGAQGLSFTSLSEVTATASSGRQGISLANIVDVASTAGRISIVAVDASRIPLQFTLYGLDPTSRSVSPILSRRHIASAEFSGDGHSAALVTCQSEACDVEVVSLPGEKKIASWPMSANRETTVTRPVDGGVLLFDSSDGWIKRASINDGAITNIVRGHKPSISMDGKYLAYVSESAIFVRNLASGDERRVYPPFFWNATGFIGRLYWREDGEVLAVNREAGLLGYDTECLLISVPEGKNVSITLKGLWCGPWIGQA